MSSTDLHLPDEQEGSEIGELEREVTAEVEEIQGGVEREEGEGEGEEEGEEDITEGTEQLTSQFEIEQVKNIDSLPENKKTLTKYEKTAAIGLRAEQISGGAPPMVKVPNDMFDPIQIAIYEFKMGSCPIFIKRLYGDQLIRVSVNDLIDLEPS